MRRSSKISSLLITIAITGSVLYAYGIFLYPQASEESNTSISVIQYTTDTSDDFNVKDKSFLPMNTSLSIPFTGFVKNIGQVHNSLISYYYTSQKSSVSFGESIIYFSKIVNSGESNVSFVTFNLTFKNSNKIRPTGTNSMIQKSNYFLGGEKFTNVLNFQDIWYYNLYPNIDLHYYMNNNGLKYDFVVKPGGNPSNIIINLSNNVKVGRSEVNSSSLYVNSNIDSKDLLIMEDSHLYAYTSDNGQVEASFLYSTDNQNSYGFSVPSYNKQATLIIDPIWLGFSTFIGGSGDDEGNSITVDGSDNIYVTGVTTSLNFPTTNGSNPYVIGSLYVLKLNSDGSNIIFSTYIGGNDFDQGTGIVVDPSGNIYVTGYTGSSNFPTTNGAFSRTFGGTIPYYDAFALKLNSLGTSLIYSTFIGGSDDDRASGIVVDESGNAYITGQTKSSDFPTTNGAYDQSLGHSSYYDCFITKLNAAGSNLIYSTYIGGSNDDSSSNIVIDGTGNAYITGKTTSSNFQTTNGAFDTVRSGNSDGFILKINATGSGLIFSTLIGGNNDDEVAGIAIDSSGNAFITGTTTSSNFQTTNGAFDTTINGPEDAFITELYANGSFLIYSTFIGGNLADSAHDIEIDSTGNTYVIGETSSSNFPSSTGIGYGGISDAFIVKLNQTGNAIVYSTYVGGNSSDSGSNIAINSIGTVFATGHTSSINFPTTKGAYNHTFGGYYDVFVFKISGQIDDTPPSIILNSPANSSYITSLNNIDVTITDQLSGVDTILYNWDGTTNISTSTTNTIPSMSTEGQHSLNIYFNDHANNWNNANYTFIIDNTQPEISSIVPINNSIEKTGIEVSFSVSDNNNVTQVLFNWDRHSNQTLNNPYSVTLPTDEGKHILYIFADDPAGNWREQEVTFIVDNTPPNATYEGISNFVTVSGTHVITITPQDANGISSVEVKVNNISTYSSTTSPYIWNWDTTQVDDGVYSVTVLTTDNAGNIHEDSFQITVKNAQDSAIDPLNVLGVLIAIAVPASGFLYIKSFSFRNRSVIKMYMNDISIEEIANKTGKTKRQIEEILRKAKKRD